MKAWQQEVQQKPSVAGRTAAFAQRQWNRIIPERVHKAITVVIQKMVKGVLFGAKLTTFKPKTQRSFGETEARADQIIKRYQNTASV